MGLEVSVAAGRMRVVMGAMLEGNGELEEGEEGKEHRQEARGLAKVGHDGRLVVLLQCGAKNRNGQEHQDGRLVEPEKQEGIKKARLRSVTTVGSSPEVCKGKKKGLAFSQKPRRR